MSAKSKTKINMKRLLALILTALLLFFIIADLVSGWPFRYIYYDLKRKAAWKREAESKSRLKKLSYKFLDPAMEDKLYNSGSGNDDSYFWVNALKKTYPDKFESEIVPLLHIPYDSEKNRYPSSFIGNTELEGIDFSKYYVENISSVFLLVEREDFDKDGFRFVLMMDGSVWNKPEFELKEVLSVEPVVIKFKNTEQEKP